MRALPSRSKLTKRGAALVRAHGLGDGQLKRRRRRRGEGKTQFAKLPPSEQVVRQLEVDLLREMRATLSPDEWISYLTGLAVAELGRGALPVACRYVPNNYDRKLGRLLKICQAHIAMAGT